MMTAVIGTFKNVFFRSLLLNYVVVFTYIFIIIFYANYFGLIMFQYIVF